MDGLAQLATDIDATAFWSGTGDRFEHAALVTNEDGNRWNRPGQPTVYLAGDVGLLLVEGGRHERPSSGRPSDRSLWRVRVRAPRILDLRHPEVSTALELSDPLWVLDRARCRDLSERLRAGDGCNGLITPSAGAADDRARWNLVLFADRLRQPIGQVVDEPSLLGILRWQG